MTCNKLSTYSLSTLDHSQETPLEKSTFSLLKNILNADELQEAISSLSNFTTSKETEIQDIEELFCWCYLYFSIQPKNIQHLLQSLIQKCKKSYLAFHSSYIQTLLALSEHFIAVTPEFSQIIINEQRAQPFLNNDLCGNKINIPLPLYQAKLGTLWAYLGKQLKLPQFIQHAVKIGLWQLETLTTNQTPFFSLFVPEAAHSFSKYLHSLSLLFFSLSQTDPSRDWKKIAEQQFTHLKQHPTSSPPSTLSLLLEHALEKLPSIQTNTSPLHSSSFYFDKQCSLICIKESQWNVACTLVGGNTGLGTITLGDLSLVNFGPQTLPLGTCSTFGINKSIQEQQRTPSRVILDSKKRTFMMQDTIRLTSNDTSIFPNQWMEITMQFCPNNLNIKITKLELETEEEVAFTFYLQTPHCQLENGTELQRRSFDQYHGASSAVWCRSNNNQLVITSDEFFEEMQLIPLGGGSNYWGTDFLLAFPLGKKQNTFSWNIKWS
jgi:hypothetical protein